MEGKVCTFFGHRECPDSVKTILRIVLEDLIVNHGVSMFYVGNQGQFDACVRRVLRDLKKENYHIRYAVVLAYMPGRKNDCDDYADTMLPDGIESVHPKYAIHWRNRWLLQQSDMVVAYIVHQWGGAAQYVKVAERQGKKVIHISPSEVTDPRNPPIFSISSSKNPRKMEKHFALCGGYAIFSESLPLYSRLPCQPWRQ
ncbi:MAG: hypothetical protein ACI3V3_04020 [Faecousia sp.]